VTLSDTRGLSDNNSVENNAVENNAIENEVVELSPKDSVLEQDPFYLDLPNLIPQVELNSGFRHTRKGIFVSEDSEHSLISAYQKWLQEQTGKEKAKNEDKCRKRLYGTEDIKLFYLLDGKRCIPGHLLRGYAGEPSTPKKGKNSIPAYQGELLDPVAFLHPKDPFLQKMENVEYKFIPSVGSILYFSSKKATTKVSFDKLQQFADVARASKDLRKRFPEIVYSLRDCIKPLKELLATARPKKGKAPSIIPNEFAKLKPSLALTHGSLTFLLDKDSNLLATYHSKGPAFRKRLLIEIEQLVTQHPLTSVKGFTLLKGKQKNLGKVRIKNASYQLEQNSFFHFLRLLLRSKSKNPLPHFITARDVMLRLISALRASKAPTEEVEKELTGGRRISGRSYRVSGKWVFVVSDKTNIAACFTRKGHYKEEPAPEHKKLKPASTSKAKKRRRARRKPKPQSKGHA
jgi:hypothetical protein